MIRHVLALALAAALESTCAASLGTILFDDARDGNGDDLTGNLSAFADLLVANDIDLVALDGAPGALMPGALTPGAWTPGVLAGVDALFIHDFELSYTPSEIGVIVDFVAAERYVLVPEPATLAAVGGLVLLWRRQRLVGRARA